MRAVLSLALCGAFLAGCGFVEDMKGMFEKAQQVSKAIKDKHGWDTQVGWNVNNGKLTQVTVMFNAGEVKEQRIGLLQAAAAEAVAKSFAMKPEVIYVQVASQPN